MNNEEILFTRKLIDKTHKLDINEDQISFYFLNNGYSDHKLRVAQKNDEIVISLKFGLFTEEPLKITQNILKCVDFSCFNPVYRQIEDFCYQKKISILFEIDVIKNRGNVDLLFFKGLKNIFSNFLVPVNSTLKNFSGLKKIIDINFERSFIDLIDVDKYAFFNEKLLKNPSAKEQEASKAVVFVFMSKNGMKCKINSKEGISEEESKVISNKIKELNYFH
ncbi:hypothetical protein NUSPORA_01349 [Nucleospora cyclopteri]